jgi:hypothetical protein
MLIIPKANHYNLMEIGMEQYFNAIEEFITTHR